jgi:hypothetical protein
MLVPVLGQGCHSRLSGLYVFALRLLLFSRIYLTNRFLRVGLLKTEMDLSQVSHTLVVAVRDSWGLMTILQ